MVKIKYLIMKTGQSINRLRVNKARQNQEIFAQNIGITQTYLSQIENGHKEPSTEVLLKIAAYLQIPLPVLFWYGIAEEDVNPDKLEHFRFLRPIIDKMLDSLF